MHRVINTYPLATLVSGLRSATELSLLPLMLDIGPGGTTMLTGRMDRNNPQVKQLKPGEGVAFVFNGPNAYASPDLYADTHLPGWLYVTVQGVGTIGRLIEGDELIAMLCEASRRFGEPAQEFLLGCDDPRFSLLINAIVGFEIEVTEISGIAKLAQDKGPEHARIACNHLAELTDPNLADLLDQLVRNTG